MHAEACQQFRECLVQFGRLPFKRFEARSALIKSAAQGDICLRLDQHDVASLIGNAKRQNF
jgi:hypothetical protein